MPHMREVKTCDRCRHFKRRCDLLKPSCSRCVQAGIRCSFDVAGIAMVAPHSSPTGDAQQQQQARPHSRHNHEYHQPSSSISSGIVGLTSPDSHPQHDNRTPSPTNNGLISPTTSTESPEPLPQTRPAETDGANGTLTNPMPTNSISATPAAGQRVIRKRKRNCLSCLRCHRLKVKCDKQLPCGRCKTSGNGRECYYSYNKGPNGGKFPCPTAPTPTCGEGAKAVLATWHTSHRTRGSSHWRDLMTKIGAIATINPTQLDTALEDVATNACLANFTLPGNFPFGTPGAAKYFARDAVARLLETERSNCAYYIEGYVELLDCVNPILDLDHFQQEVEQYWLDPHAVGLCWLSQFLMVMGLGCFTRSEESPTATELMMAAEACLMQTPFMFRPTLLTLKTVSLMVVAKQVCNATCWSVDSCWSLLGLLVRTAFIHGLPQERTETDDKIQDPVERDARRKLWLTIIYLDIKVSMCTGMPPLTRPEELGSLTKLPDWGQPDSLQMVLYQSLPTILAVLAQINSKQVETTYAEVLQFNSQIRELMAHAQRVCSNQLQRSTVDIFLRRCLMVLHRPFALHPEGPVAYPESYWGSLECSLAILMHYRDLWATENTMRQDLVGRAFVLDFFSASLTIALHVLRKDAPLASAAAMGCHIPPQQIILETLRNCIDIWAGEKEKSVCYRTGYNLLRAVLALLPEV